MIETETRPTSRPATPELNRSNIKDATARIEQAAGINNQPLHRDQDRLNGMGGRPSFGVEEGMAAEAITIDTGFGPRPIDVPATPEDKFKFLRGVLARVEQTLEPQGGPANQTSLQTLGQLVEALRKPEYTSKHNAVDDENKDIGEKMLKEYEARIRFHTSYVAFYNANDIAGVKQAVDYLQGQDFNSLFNIPEFVHALNYYEKWGDHPNLATSVESPQRVGFTEESKADFRLQLRGAIAQELGQPADELGWAQNLAERWYEESGRRASHDTTKGNWETADFNFTDDPVGGNFALRKLIRFKDYLLNQKEHARPKDQLLRKPCKIDLKAEDYVQYLMPGSDKKHALPENAVYTDTTGKVKIDFTKVDWKKFDFGEIGRNPMRHWSYEKIAKPEAAREALWDKPDSFLRNPTQESLYALNGVFDYLKKDRWEVHRNLAINFIRYAQKERMDLTGKQKYTQTQVFAMVNYLTGIHDDKLAPFLDPKDKTQVLKEATGQDDPEAVFARKRAAFFFLLFLIGFILEAGKESVEELGKNR